MTAWHDTFTSHPEHDITIVTATNMGTFLDTHLALQYNQAFQDDLLDIVFE